MSMTNDDSLFLLMQYYKDKTREKEKVSVCTRYIPNVTSEEENMASFL